MTYSCKLSSLVSSVIVFFLLSVLLSLHHCYYYFLTSYSASHCRFLGHGNGCKYLRPRELAQMDCRAAVLLMGCSSGSQDARGLMEPSGVTSDYHASLWSVSALSKLL